MEGLLIYECWEFGGYFDGLEFTGDWMSWRDCGVFFGCQGR